MLSRIAVTLYLLGRHLERAEHLARTLRVHNELVLDRPARDDHVFWPRYMQLVGWPLSDQLTREQAIELTLTGSVGPSVRRAVSDARSAALAVRTSLSTDVFEQVNSLHWRLQNEDWHGVLDAYLRAVELGVHLIGGLVEDTMAHDEAWDFIRLGKFLERASATTRLVLGKSAELSGLPELEEASVDWAAALRCCSSFEAYQQRVPAPFRPERVVGFLLFQPVSPRSAAFCVTEALASVRRVDGARAEPSPPQRALGELARLFAESVPDEVAEAPDEFGEHFAELFREVELALRETYFLPHNLAVSLPGDTLVAHPHQQQQARAGAR
jgi:uncharacterized alpha-E superfamily protein